MESEKETTQMKILKRFALRTILAILYFFGTEALHAQMPPGWTFPPILDSFSFEDITNWTSDTGDAPLSFTNLVAVAHEGDINSDYALLLDSTNPAWLSFALTDDTVTNLVLPEGSLTLWIAPADWASTSTSGSGPGTRAELFSAGQWTTNASIGYWGLSISADGNDLSFSAQTNSDDGVTATYLTEPISWITNEWHFIGLSWSETNSALYLDGQLVTNGPGVTILPGSSVTNLYIGGDSFGFSQCRAYFDDIYTFGTNLDSTNIQNIYDSQYYEFFLNPYNNFSYNADSENSSSQYEMSLAVDVSAISNHMASLLAMNATPDTLYEIQSKTNLTQPGWNSEGFLYGSELTNWTAANVSQNGRPILFLRLRSWQDSTGTGIPDWWWLQYFGQITNADAYASAAGDGYSNLQKFQMGLNPTNYYNTNPPPGFFGALVNKTNAAIVWSPSPGPVANYLVQRGIFNTNTGNYDYTSFVLNSNTTVFEDVGVITNDNAQLNSYNLEALYAGGNVTGTDTWYVTYYTQQGNSGPPYGPPTPTNAWAYPDASGTNLLISWTAAQGTPTNYIIERGIFDPVADDYNYYPITQVGTNTNSVEIFGEFRYATNWQNAYAVVAAYPNGILSQPSISGINAGPPTGPAAPSSFYGYMDSTGTNAYLSWNLLSNATGYIIYQGTWNYFVGPLLNGFYQGAYSYMEVGSVGAGTNSFEVIGANDVAGDYSGNAYTVVAVYSGGSLSLGASPWQVSTGSAAPGTFYAYLDSTGTNVLLAWTTNTPGATGYILSRSGDGGNSYSSIAQVGSTTSTYEDTNGVAAGQSGVASLMYEIQAAYPHGGLSVQVITNVLSTPPAPSGLTANVDSTGTNVVLAWTPAVGPVSQYIIEQGVYDASTGDYTYSQIGTVSASSGVTSFTAYGAFTGGNSVNNVYEALAEDTDGQISDPDDSDLNSPAPSATCNLDISARLIRNEQGRWELMFSEIPTNVQSVALSWYMYNYFYDYFYPYNYLGAPVQPFSPVNDIPMSQITNNIYVLSDADATNWFGNNGWGKFAMVQPIRTDGAYGQLVEAGVEPYDSPVFVDTRRHMKQNLIYEIRSATESGWDYVLQEQNVWINNGWVSTEQVSLPDTNYVESSFFHYSVQNKWVSEGGGSWTPSYLKMDNVWPITVNYELHQMLYDTNYSVPLGFEWQPQDGSNPQNPVNLLFQGPLTNDPAPPVLGLGDPYWTEQIVDPQTGQSLSNMPVYIDGSDFYFQSGMKNLFGLPFDTALVNNAATNSYEVTNGGIVTVTTYGTPTTLDPGKSIAMTDMDCFDSQTSDPGLVLTNYYFAPVVTPGTALPGEPQMVEPYPIPALNGFSNTNQTGIIIGSVGTPMVIGGWARFAITNGDPTKFAYLGQYFDTNAILYSNGVQVSDSPGVISPYGEFFPTQPGVVVLSTLPDIDTEDVGLASVRVISLNVDANRDGTMDFTYNGPDFVSTNKPFRFWVDDSADSGDFGGNSGIPGLLTNNNTTLQINGEYVIHGRRDMVNLFPVYLNIRSLFETNVQSQAINPLDSSWQFILSQADGALRFAYTDLTPTNYMDFLHDATESGQLAYGSGYPGYSTLTTITSNGVALSSGLLAGMTTDNEGIILVQAWKETTQPLVLTIYHGTNQIAQTQLPLSITGVEQMFRSKTMLLNPLPGTVPDRLTDASVPNEPDTIAKNFVFLHGYNVLPNEARGVATDTFKRLYWSGSHAKFYAVTWQGADSKGAFPFYDLFTPNYHTNVGNAFLTAPMLANFITTLTNSGPVVTSAHSLGNMVVLSAISDWNAPISQDFMIDAAVPVEAIDPAAVTNMMVYSTWVGYSNGLFASDWYQLFPTNDARSTLFWNDRLGNLGHVDIYNCYSTGEEVCRTTTNDPPAGVLDMIKLQAAYRIWDGYPFGCFTWYWQEKGKGTSTQDWFLGSTSGGWGFNQLYGTNIVNFFTQQPEFIPMSISASATLTLTQLQTNAFFGWVGGDLALQGSGGSAYAQTNRNRLLADSIPAMSVVAAANPVPSFSGNHNIDLMTMENGWALGRTGTEVNMWHHSDFHDMAYTFTYPFFDKVVTVGKLK